MRKVVFRTICLVFLTYVTVGTFGYITFANNMEPLQDVTKANGVVLLAYGFDIDGVARTYPVLVTIVRDLNPLVPNASVYYNDVHCNTCCGTPKHQTC